MPVSNIGVFGGSFNPVHNGHIKLAESAMKILCLSKVIWVPAGCPPHKNTNVEPASDRLEMLRIALEDKENMEISDIETKRSGKSYTVDTLREIAAKYPDGRLFLLCGADMFLTLQDWYDSGSIFSLCSVVCMAREKGQKEKLLSHGKILKARYGADVFILDELPLFLSSTNIRKLIKQGKSTKGLIPDKVREYIDERKLYTEKIRQADLL